MTDIEIYKEKVLLVKESKQKMLEIKKSWLTAEKFGEAAYTPKGWKFLLQRISLIYSIIYQLGEALKFTDKTSVPTYETSLIFNAIFPITNEVIKSNKEYLKTMGINRKMRQVTEKRKIAEEIHHQFVGNSD